MLTRSSIASDASRQIRSQRLGHAGGARLERPRRVDRARREHVVVDVAQRLELAVEQDRLVEHELVRMLGRLVEEVLLRAEGRRQAHHDFLADRVDRRVGDLREQLLEVGEQRRRLVGEHGQREVVAHRADRLGAVARHRREQHAQVLLACSRTRAGARAAAGLRSSPGRRAGSSEKGTALRSYHSR